MSAEELENACKKSMHLTVNDTKLFAEIMEKLNLNYTIISEHEAEIYSDTEVTPLVLALNDNGCNVISMTQNNESLESYFIKLIGGAHNA